MSNHVQITKLTRLPDRPNGDLLAIDYTGSIEEGYSIRGYLTAPIECGKRVFVDRYERNGIKIEGEFVSSPVAEYGDLYDDGRFCIRTENSVYLMEQLG